MSETLLSINDLTITVQDNDREKVIVSKVNFQVPAQSITALVGGSGSGKTTLGLAALRLLSLGLEVRSGKIIYNGEDLLKVPEERIRQLRGKEISMVFQEPLLAFNPVMTLGDQIEEVLIYHTDLSDNARSKRILELLNLAGISDPQRVARSYPHQLSGGLRQRAMIAQAIAASPKLIIADEPTSSLDVTLQAKIMELFRTIRKELNLSILLITHDLGVVSHLADNVSVITQGQIIETGTADQIVNHPRENYTKMLMEAFR